MDYNTAIFVFGSNESGLHGAGAAAFALRHKGAILRQAVGLQGQSYGIPTKNKSIRYTLPLDVIQCYVNGFLQFADTQPHMTFQVTRIGCGLAGLDNSEVAPMFKGAPSNCWFDEQWFPWLGESVRYWGTK